MKNQFMAGVGRAVITPPLGTKLYGYAFQRAATKVNDDLRVNAIAVEQGDLKAILISADVVSIGEDLADKVSALISEETGVPAKNISISTIHTHSGPAMKSSKARDFQTVRQQATSATFMNSEALRRSMPFAHTRA